MNSPSRGWRHDFRLLALAALLLPLALCCVLYFLWLRPAAVDSAARQLRELTLITQQGLQALPSEQQSEFGATLRQRLDYTLLDDALAGPRLTAPHDGWLTSVGERLRQLSQDRLSLKVGLDGKDVWLNVETDERRYWLAVPMDRIQSGAPLWLAGGLGLVLYACVLCALFILHRRLVTLRRYTEAVRQVGVGEVALTLKEAGPPEERDFSRVFNAMTRSLQRLDSESRLLLGGISHDLRTPLTSMRLGLELAKDEIEPGLAASLYQDAEDIESILNQFLDYARDDSLEPAERGDINALILEIGKRVTERGHDIDLDLAPVPALHFRKLAMRRLITNLVNNALNYAGVGVGVRTRPGAGGSVIISVVDSGPGIDAAQLKELLRPFVRGAQHENRHPGSGLGLTIASRIARIHAGSLSLLNRPEGGLEARIELPPRDEQS